MISLQLSQVQRIAKRFKNRGIPYQDLVQVGSLGLVKAINSFDPAKGVDFTTFATHYILGEIKHHFRLQRVASEGAKVPKIVLQHTIEVLQEKSTPTKTPSA